MNGVETPDAGSQGGTGSGSGIGNEQQGTLSTKEPGGNGNDPAYGQSTAVGSPPSGSSIIFGPDVSPTPQANGQKKGH